MKRSRYLDSLIMSILKLHKPIYMGALCRTSSFNPPSMVRYIKEELNEKFKDKREAEIQRLIARGQVSDDQIDLSDIPEITDWSNAVRHNQFYRPVKNGRCRFKIGNQQ